MFEYNLKFTNNDIITVTADAFYEGDKDVTFVDAGDNFVFWANKASLISFKKLSKATN